MYPEDPLKIEMNEKILRGIKPPTDQERVVLWDSRQKGLGLVVHRTGTMAWVCRYSLNGRPGKVTMGQWPDLSYDEAVKKARKIRGKVADGEDPRRDRSPSFTFGDLIEKVEAEHYPGLAASTVRTYRMLLKRHILPKLGKVPLEAVDLGAVGKVHHALRSQERTANQALAVISKALHLAEGWGLRDPNSNPCGALARFKETKRDRYLTTAEAARLGEKMAEAEKHWDHWSMGALRFAMLTGMRKGEIVALRWHQVKGDHIILKEHKTAGKVGARKVFLSEPAQEVLKAVPRMLKDPLVFPGCASGMRRLWDELREGETFADVRIHDLRHTFASVGLAEGLTLEQIGGLLGHKAAATTKRYAHLLDEAGVAAAGKAGGAVSRRLGGL